MAREEYSDTPMKEGAGSSVAVRVSASSGEASLKGDALAALFPPSDQAPQMVPQKATGSLPAQSLPSSVTPLAPGTIRPSAPAPALAPAPAPAQRSHILPSTVKRLDLHQHSRCDLACHAEERPPQPVPPTMQCIAVAGNAPVTCSMSTPMPWDATPGTATPPFQAIGRNKD